MATLRAALSHCGSNPVHIDKRVRELACLLANTPSDGPSLLNRGAMARVVKEGRTFWTTDGGHVRLANPTNWFNKYLQHGFEIECRAADDLEHIGADIG